MPNHLELQISAVHSYQLSLADILSTEAGRDVVICTCTCHLQGDDNGISIFDFLQKTDLDSYALACRTSARRIEHIQI